MFGIRVTCCVRVWQWQNEINKIDCLYGVSVVTYCNSKEQRILPFEFCATGIVLLLKDRKLIYQANDFNLWWNKKVILMSDEKNLMWQQPLHFTFSWYIRFNDSEMTKKKEKMKKRWKNTFAWIILINACMTRTVYNVNDSH